MSIPIHKNFSAILTEYERLDYVKYEKNGKGFTISNIPREAKRAETICRHAKQGILKFLFQFDV